MAFFEIVVAKNVEEASTFLCTLINTSSISSQQPKVCQKLVNVIYHALISEEDLYSPDRSKYLKKTWQETSFDRSTEFSANCLRLFLCCNVRTSWRLCNRVL